jgi:hypothetical protein
MPPTKYGQYVTRDIIVDSKYPQVTAPMARYNGCRGGGNALTVEWSCITKPFAMDAEPEVDTERDQLLLFASSNIEDGKDFNAEIELPMGKEKKKQIITEPTYVYIPKGLVHGPIKFKTIRKPIAFLSYFLSPEFSTGWNEPDYSKYLATQSKSKPIMTPRPAGTKPNLLQFTHPGGTPFRYTKGMGMDGGGFSTPMGWSSHYGWPAKVSPAYMVTRNRENLLLEPVHAHRDSHQISMYLGSNPLDISDFDATIEIFMGKEREMHIIDTCAVDHYVPGIVHLGDEVRRVGKPFIHIMWVIGPYMEDYYKAAAKDKVLLSDLSKGEVMIAEGARDYVPPTKIEDWVWPYPKKK